MLLVFDLDGTLIDSRRDLCTGINLMRRHYGLPPLPLATVSSYVGDGIRKLVERSLSDTSGINIDEAVRINSNFYRAHLHDETTLYPGVDQGLHRLREAGHVIALISNKPELSCRDLLQHFKLEKIFSKIMGGDSVKNLKPHPDALLMTMDSLNYAPHATWMIGDSVNDLACARRAGAHGAFVTYGIGRAYPEKAELTFDDFTALTEHFTPD